MSDEKNFKEKMEEFAAKIYEKTGAKMDVEGSLYNLQIAKLCESQRMNSDFPMIPVISEVEISDREVFDGKMDNFGTDLFFFLKEQEDAFDNDPYPSSFYGEDKEIDAMVKEALLDAAKENAGIFAELLNGCKSGDKIRIRRHITNPNVTAKVCVPGMGDEPEIEDTDEFVIILQMFPENEEDFMKVVDCYPI